MTGPFIASHSTAHHAATALIKFERTRYIRGFAIHQSVLGTFCQAV